jgi:hypothetical protein
MMGMKLVSATYCKNLRRNQERKGLEDNTRHLPFHEEHYMLAHAGRVLDHSNGMLLTL